MKQIVSTYRNITYLQQSLAYWNEKGYRLSNIFWAAKMNTVGNGYNTSTYCINATLNSAKLTLECWKEGSKEWCHVEFGNAACNNMLFVHHGYDDDTDTQPNLFDALGFKKEEN